MKAQPTIKTLRLYWDVETGQIWNEEKEEKELIVYLIGVYTDEEGFKYFTTLKEFAEYLVYLNKTFNKRLELCAYNASYDVTTIINDWMDNYGAKWNISFDNQGTLMECTAKTNIIKSKIVFRDIIRFNKFKPLRIVFEEMKNEGWDVESKGSINYNKWYVSVNQEKGTIGFYTEKEKINYQEISLEEELSYLKKDTRQLATYILYLREFKNDMKKELDYVNTAFRNSRFSLSNIDDSTSPTFIWSLVQDLTKEDVSLFYKFPVSLEQHTLEESSVMGGISGYNTKVSCSEGDIYCIDINASYPYTIAQGLAYGLIVPKFEETQYWKDTIEWVLIKYKNISYKPHFDYLNQTPIKKPTKEDIILGGKVMYITRELLNIVEEMCNCDYKILDTQYQLYGKTGISQLQQKIFEMRLKYRKDMKKAIEKKDFKLADSIKSKENKIKQVANSVFGKLIQRTYFKTKVWDNEERKIKNELNSKTTVYKSRLSGLAIINFSRARLLRTIMDFIDLGFEILYVDTDSIFFKDKPNIKWPIKIDDGSTLGAWKLECKGAKFLSPHKCKRYCLMDSEGKALKIGAGGFPIVDFYTLSKEDLEIFFSPNYNIILKGQKNKTTKNYLSQTTFEKIDIMSNSSLEYIDGEILFEDRWVIKLYPLSERPKTPNWKKPK